MSPNLIDNGVVSDHTFRMTPLQRVLDLQLVGGIDAYVTHRRDAGRSWDDIAAEINRKLPNERPINGNNLRRWYDKKDVAA